MRILEQQIKKRDLDAEQQSERIRRYEIEISEYKSRISDAEYKIGRLNESEQASKRYEMKIEQLSLEIERLNSVLQKKVSEIGEYQSRIS